MTTPALMTTELELDHAYRESQTRLVVIFKHSTGCGISANAYQQFRDWLEDRSGADVLYTTVEIQNARAISDEIERRTGVRHESPQVLILQKGQVVWSGSHWQVTPDAVEQALQDAAAD